MNKIAKVFSRFQHDQEFHLGEFIAGFDRYAVRLFDSPFRYDGDQVYWFAYRDWKEIADYAKEACGWNCQKCLTYLGASSNRKFLQAHYTEGGNDGALANVRPLCVKCHSQVPGHQRLQMDRLYLDFI